MAGINVQNLIVYFLSFNQIRIFFGSHHKMSATAASEFPATLEGFRLAFNGESACNETSLELAQNASCNLNMNMNVPPSENGELRQIEPSTGAPGDKPFEFAVTSDPQKNQRRYEALGDIITEYVYSLLEQNGLQRIPLTPNDPQSTFVFASKSDFSSTDKLMVLIHGTGVVRAGQWSRSLIINQSLDKGTQLSYIKHARDLGYEVLVTNTNDNYRDSRPVPGSDRAEAHGRSVWDRFISPAKNLKHVAIVAHSYGGIVTVNLAQHKPDEFKRLVFGVAFTDSVHGFGRSNKSALDILKPVSWVEADIRRRNALTFSSINN